MKILFKIGMSILTIVIVVIVILLFTSIITYPKKQRAYTISIINGNSYMSYTSEMQVDSFKTAFDKRNLQTLTVYKDGNSLFITADQILIHKNR
jgi:bacteriorhodopsin